jgi:putative copper export protein
VVYLLVVRPALRAGGADSAIERAVGARFQEVVEASALVLAVSGVVLAVVRLSSGAAGPVYAVLLGLKVLLALAMFALATELRWSGRRPGQRAGRGALSRLTLVLGIVVVLLAVVLRRVFEAGLGP